MLNIYRIINQKCIRRISFSSIDKNRFFGLDNCSDGISISSLFLFRNPNVRNNKTMTNEFVPIRVSRLIKRDTRRFRCGSILVFLSCISNRTVFFAQL